MYKLPKLRYQHRRVLLPLLIVLAIAKLLVVLVLAEWDARNLDVAVSPRPLRFHT